MALVLITRLRKVTSIDSDKIELFPNTLSYRIEIKSISQASDGRWHLWFIPPDEIEDENVISGDLD